MANVLDLRRRIRSVKSTRQITKAMKMIAAAKLRRAQERAVSARPYANMLASVIIETLRSKFFTAYYLRVPYVISLENHQQPLPLRPETVHGKRIHPG